MRIAIALVAGCLLGACAQDKPAPVQVVADSFCIAAKKRTWSVNDTPETISEIMRHNQGIDRACGIPGKSSPAVVAFNAKPG